MSRLATTALRNVCVQTDAKMYICRLGLDPKILAGIINTSSGRCWSSDTYNPVPGVMEGVPSSSNYEGGFGTALMTKVYAIALFIS